METKHLDAKGKGEVDYDYKNDILLFKITGREYKKSLDFENLVLDVDTEGFITGIQLFEASKLFKIPKDALLKIRRWEFNAKVEDKIITVQIVFEALKRNRVVVERGHNLQRESSSPLRNSEALCRTAA
jgi:uncharacterized protein YuzE